ncbi:twin-arginine translocation signal domain-containing protein [Leifsonia sp. PS1209]|uniref:twin-arginine translocation signal domain-containing protein n=1 Tax=Leifsonia sp. PS1209 TaxID=2724914 RepID=UPI001FFC1776|nr:twin-arginine translocation signal domain-containing protein [Leifsonia sp. PS1209]
MQPDDDERDVGQPAPSRRAFLKTAGIAGIGAAVGGVAAGRSAHPSPRIPPRRSSTRPARSTRRFPCRTSRASST